MIAFFFFYYYYLLTTMFLHYLFKSMPMSSSFSIMSKYRYHPSITATSYSTTSSSLFFSSSSLGNEKINEKNEIIMNMSNPMNITTTTSTTDSSSSSSIHNEMKKNDTNTILKQQQQQSSSSSPPQPIHLEEGLCAVYKPINWTSNDVVSYIKGILERDAKQRGVTLAKRRSRKSKNKIKIGHGGTLDPLAEGILVLGIGSGTKILTTYLSGTKSYDASGKFGFETNTLDLEGNVTKYAPYHHITNELINKCIEKNFIGTIQQVPPLFSAIRKNGKRLYEQAREGKSEDDIEIEAREVKIYNLKYIPDEEDGLPTFHLSIQCGGGTYIRSLIRDIGYDLDSVATMTRLVRTQQGPFLLNDALARDDWNADNIYAAVARNNNNLCISSESKEED